MLVVQKIRLLPSLILTVIWPFLLLLLLLVFLAFMVFPRPDLTPSIIDTTDGNAQIFFAADSHTVPFPNDCVNVRWSVEGIRSVSLNGAGVIGAGEQQVCIVDDTQPLRLDVEMQDGTLREYTLPIEIQSQRPIYAVLFGLIWLLAVLSADQIFSRRGWPLALGIILTPLTISLYLVYFFHGASLTDFIPVTSDEIMYWHQALTFQQAGFNGGYYTLSERPAQIAWSHFYAWGPLYPMIYGSIGRGWELYTAPLINIALITLGLTWFAARTAFSRAQKFFVLLIVLTFWGAHRFVLSNLQESLHIALACCLAWGFYALIEGRASRRLKVVLFVMLTAGSLMRFGWGILFLPYFLFVLGLSPRRWLLALILTGLCVLVTTGLFIMLAAQYRGDGGIGSFIRLAVQGEITPLIQGITNNVLRFVQGDIHSRALRYTTLALMIISAGLLGRAVWKRTAAVLGVDEIVVRRRQHIYEMTFHLINLSGILTANLLLNTLNDQRDYRVIVPHVLLSLLLLAAFKRRWIVSLIVVSNLLLLPAMLETLALRSAAFYQDSAMIDELNAAWRNVLRYDPNTPNAWCNTVDLPSDVSWEYLAVPAGIGITRIYPTELPLKAHWIVLNANSPLYGQETNLERLIDTPLGDLYYNPDSGCAPP